VSGDFTRIGFLFWEWEPIRHLDPVALKLWMVVYTKCQIPGLWCGDVQDLSSQAFLTADQTLRGLDILLDAGLIEFDRAARVLRLTQLPDAGEWPGSPNIMLSWWKIFTRKVPCCDIRDAHVTTLRWLLEEGARHSNRAQRPTDAHEQVWAETFGTIAIPSKRSRGVRKFSDSDTSTIHQPSLFAIRGGGAIPDAIPKASPSESPPKIRSETITSTLDPISMGSGEGEGDGDGVCVLPAGSDSGSDSGDPESTPQAKVIPFPKSPDALRVLVASFPSRVNAARDRVASELGITGYRPVALMGGEQTLLERLRESGDPPGDLEHVLAVAEAEALANRELRWLGWSMVEPKAWRVRQAATLSEIRSRPEDRNVFRVAHETVNRMDWEDP